MHAIRTANVDIIALIRGAGSDEQISVFENPDMLRAWSEKRAYRVAGIGHSENSTTPDLLSDFAASTPAGAGTHIPDALRTRWDPQQHVAQLRAQNDELCMQLRQVQMHRAAQPLTPSPAPAKKEIPSQAQQNAPTLLRLVLALLIGMVAGVMLLLWFPNQR